MTLTFGSLFAGIGGFDLGFEQAGFKCKWQVEIDDFATKVLEHHWPDVERWGDVHSFPPDGTDRWKVDVITAGWPCQDLSYAGKGAGIHGSRSGLFSECIRVARLLRPRALVMENVSAIKRRGMSNVLAALAIAGFDAEWRCIRASDSGAPHRRERMFIVAYRRGERLEGVGKVGSEAESVRRVCGEPTRLDRVSMLRGLPVCSPLAFTCSRLRVFCNRGKRWRDINYGPLFGSDVWPTFTGSIRMVDGIPNRMDRLKSVGNAVVPKVAYDLATVLKSKLESEGNSDDQS